MADANLEVKVKVMVDDLVDLAWDWCARTHCLSLDTMWLSTRNEMILRQILTLFQKLGLGIVFGLFLGQHVSDWTAAGITCAMFLVWIALDSFDRKSPGSAAAYALQEGLRALHPEDADG
jgi:hypothetical protein